MNFIENNEVTVLTLEERNEFLKSLTYDQKNVLYTYRKWLWISKFQTDIIGDSQWSFVGYEQDPDYEIHLGNENRYHCECGRGVKYLYEIKSRKGKKNHFLGVNHLSQHLGISQSAVKEIISKNNQVQYDIDNLLIRYFRGERFPKELYEYYKRTGCESTPRTNFEKKLVDFSRVEFPLSKSDKRKLNRAIREQIIEQLYDTNEVDKVRVSSVSKKLGISRKKLINIAQNHKLSVKSGASTLSREEIQMLLKAIDFGEIILLENKELEELPQYRSALIDYSTSFPRYPFDKKSINKLTDIIYEIVQWEKTVHITTLEDEIRSFYSSKDELEEFDDFFELTQIIGTLVTDGEIYINTGYLSSKKITPEEIKTLPNFEENNSENGSVFSKETEYKAVLPSQPEWLFDETYMLGYLLTVITEESPIHVKFLRKRIETIMEENFDNVQFDNCIQKLKDKSGILQKEEFLYYRNVEIKSIRKNSFGKLNRRKSDYISTEELKNVVDYLIIKEEHVEFSELIKNMKIAFDIVNFSNKTIDRIRKIAANQ